jgi:hypothetical protein
MPSGNKEGYEITNYGSFEGMYAVLVEPWLRKSGSISDVFQRSLRALSLRKESSSTCLARF